MARRRTARPKQPESEAPEPEKDSSLSSLLTRDGALVRLQGGAIGRVVAVRCDWSFALGHGLRRIAVVLPGAAGTEFDGLGTWTKPEAWWREKLAEDQSPVTEQELAQIHALVLKNRIRVLRHLIDTSQAELEAYERELKTLNADEPSRDGFSWIQDLEFKFL